MYRYTICSETYEALFHLQCAALKKHIPGLEDVRLLEDVDGSNLHIYRRDGKKLVVHNDYEIGSIYIKSEFDLTPYFPQAKISPYV